RLEELLAAIHAEFKEWVRARRGTKLTAPEELLFNGRFWTGREALPLGLIDQLGHADTEIRRRFGAKVKLMRFGPRKPSLPLRLLGGAATMLEERAAWGRIGL